MAPHTEAREWLKQAARHGVMPISKRLEEHGVITPGELGSKVEMTSDGVSACVQMIEDQEQRTMCRTRSNRQTSTGDHDRGNKRRREKTHGVTDEETRELAHAVQVVFGDTGAGPEVWLGVKLSSRTRGKVRLQFLEDIKEEAGMFMLTKVSGIYNTNQIEHVFANVVFLEKTTYKISKWGRR